ncbi:Stp1/IreP family PP2C-type Ser/Thr phosphatase [uncultured Clostridium sp.]|jgi:protein phosphatase|uniref:Stp1/IreP family PP2C-type Ser/Thr phosphatase n=1 Tax=uncultured Clostridium sp. TaxID=59620 RepID=UPI0026353618|nr:Stp1/IreP family PP2C-type Ser/Thr phosphatase [uncultured Clostridium sp.]
MVGFVTDIGNVREINEDYANYYLGEGYKLYVVADGMGGHNAGEVASKMAVDGMISFIKDNYKKINDNEILIEAVAEVNYKIYKHSLEANNLSGMGTTIAAAFATEKVIRVVNVGDSVCYGIERDAIDKITKDHSLVQELLDTGSISVEEARNHPRKNIITRAVGTNIRVEVDQFTVPRNIYDYFVLCTDGLSNEVSEEEIFNEIRWSNDLKESSKRLVDMAKDAGGKDNITVLVFGGEK